MKTISVITVNVNGLMHQLQGIIRVDQDKSKIFFHPDYFMFLLCFLFTHYIYR